MGQAARRRISSNSGPTTLQACGCPHTHLARRVAEPSRPFPEPEFALVAPLCGQCPPQPSCSPVLLAKQLTTTSTGSLNATLRSESRSSTLPNRTSAPGNSCAREEQGGSSGAGQQGGEGRHRRSCLVVPDLQPATVR